MIAPKWNIGWLHIIQGANRLRHPLQGLGASDCKRGLARDRRKSKTANRSTAICGWALRSILELASIWRVQSSVLQSDVPRPCRRSVERMSVVGRAGAGPRSLPSEIGAKRHPKTKSKVITFLSSISPLATNLATRLSWDPQILLG